MTKSRIWALAIACAATTALTAQLRTLNVDRYQTKIVFRPTTIVPDFDLSVGEN